MAGSWDLLSHHFHCPIQLGSTYGYFLRLPRVCLLSPATTSLLPRPFSPHLVYKSALGTAILVALLVTLTSLTLGSSLKLTIGCQAFTSLPKLLTNTHRLPMLLGKNHSRWSGSISNVWSKIASLSSLPSRVLSSLTSFMLSFPLLCQLLLLAKLWLLSL